MSLLAILERREKVGETLVDSTVSLCNEWYFCGAKARVAEIEEAIKAGFSPRGPLIVIARELCHD